MQVKHDTNDPTKPTWSWSEFASTTATDPPKQVPGSFEELVKRVSNPPTCNSKQVQPLLKLALFGQARTANGSYRSDGNVIAITGVEGDHDAGTVSVSEAIKLLERWHVKAVVFTTATHTPEKPRWRVLAPCSKEVPPQDRYKLVARLNGALEGSLSNESFTLSQSFYFGRVANARFECQATFDGEDGEFIDLLDDLDNCAVGKREWARLDPQTNERQTTKTVDAETFKTAVTDLGRKLRTGDGKRDMLRSFIGSQFRQGATIEKVTESIKQIDANYFDDSIDWENINKLIVDLENKDKELCALGQRIWVNIKASADRKQEAMRKTILVPIDERGALEPLPTLISEFLPLDGVGMLWAEPGSYKSFIALDFGLCVASGLPWFGRQVVQGGVWYLAGEGHAGLRLRLAAWRSARRYNGPINFLHSQRAVTLDDEGSSAGLEMLMQCVSEGIIPRFVIVDTLARAMTGDESATKDMNRFVSALDALVAKIREAGHSCCVLLVHHSRKDGEIYRGSSSLRGAADFEFEMRRTGKLSCVLRSHKVKDGNMPPEVHLNGRVVHLGWATDNHGQRAQMTSLAFEPNAAPAPETLTQEALKLLPSIRSVLRKEFPTGASKTLLADALRKSGAAFNDKRFGNLLEALAAHGHVQIDRGAKGQSWQVTDAGAGGDSRPVQAG
jgi:hypothetical protein